MEKLSQTKKVGINIFKTGEQVTQKTQNQRKCMTKWKGTKNKDQRR